MSATLRYTIGANAAELLRGRDRDFWEALGPVSCHPWHGWGRSTCQAYRFSVRLPGQVWHAWRLHDLAGRARRETLSRQAVHSLEVLHVKLTWALGLRDLAILGPLEAARDDLTRWGVYADCLEESPRPEDVRRGQVIRAWLAPAATPVRLGVPVLAGPWKEEAP
jgi:hypothetical protein